MVDLEIDLSSFAPKRSNGITNLRCCLILFIVYFHNLKIWLQLRQQFRGFLALLLLVVLMVG